MISSATFPDLRDASVFITGGGSGIGAALTEGFLRQGARVAFIGRSDYTDFADEMEKKTSTRPLFLQGDVTDTPALHAAMDEASTAHGPLRILVNNAANDQRFDSAAVTVEDWDAMMAVNLRHQFFAAQKAAQIMSAVGEGVILNYTSIAYMTGVKRLSVYVSAKAAITGMTRSLAHEWGEKGIRVNCIAPGMVLTEKQLDTWIDEADIEAQLEAQALKIRMGPEDLVGPSLFLCSDAARLIAGQCLIVDGGVAVSG